MESHQVQFGRRGVSASASTTDEQRDHGEGWHQRLTQRPHDVEMAAVPSAVVNRSKLKLVVMSIFMVGLMVLTAGGRRHSSDLPYWLRPGDQLTFAHLAAPLALVSVVILVWVVDSLRRPVAFAFYPTYFEYFPLIGWKRTVAWSEIADIRPSYWSNKGGIIVELDSGRKLRCQASGLDYSRAELIVMLEDRRGASCLGGIMPASSSFDGQYLFPGH